MVIIHQALNSYPIATTVTDSNDQYEERVCLTKALSGTSQAVVFSKVIMQNWSYLSQLGHTKGLDQFLKGNLLKLTIKCFLNNDLEGFEQLQLYQQEILVMLMKSLKQQIKNLLYDLIFLLPSLVQDGSPKLEKLEMMEQG